MRRRDADVARTWGVQVRKTLEPQIEARYRNSSNIADLSSAGGRDNLWPRAVRSCWHQKAVSTFLRLVYGSKGRWFPAHDIQSFGNLGTDLSQNPGSSLSGCRSFSGAASVARLKSGAMKLDLPSPAMLLTVRRAFQREMRTEHLMRGNIHSARVFL